MERRARNIQVKANHITIYHPMDFICMLEKNNLQNDELTFKFANGGDMWFHAKKMPGSHVIVRMEGAETLPDKTYEESCAACRILFFRTGQSKG